MIAYSQVLHLDAPAKRTVEAIDKFVSSPDEHEGKEWWGYRLKYRLQNEVDETEESRDIAESDPKAGGEDITVPDLVSLYTPGENDLISRGVDKFLYPFFLVCFAFQVSLLSDCALSPRSVNTDRPPNQPTPQST